MTAERELVTFYDIAPCVFKKLVYAYSGFISNLLPKNLGRNELNSNRLSCIDAVVWLFRSELKMDQGSS